MEQYNGSAYKTHLFRDTLGQRDLPAAKRFLRKALIRFVRPDCIVIDGSQPIGKQSCLAMLRTVRWTDHDEP